MHGILMFIRPPFHKIKGLYELEMSERAQRGLWVKDGNTIQSEKQRRRRWLFQWIKSDLGYKQKQPRITFIIIHSQNLFMNIDSKTLDEQEPTKCTSCKSFYGSQAHKGLCSSCFKKSQSEKNDIEVDNLRKESVDTQADAFLSLEEKLQQIELPKPQVKQQKEEIKPAAEEAPKQVDKKRCYNCKKKVGLLGIQCKCGFVHCNTHRLPEEHGCTFNHKKVANDRLKEALVKVYNGKIAQI